MTHCPNNNSKPSQHNNPSNNNPPMQYLFPPQVPPQVPHQFSNPFLFGSPPAPQFIPLNNPTFLPPMPQFSQFTPSSPMQAQLPYQNPNSDDRLISSFNIQNYISSQSSSLEYFRAEGLQIHRITSAAREALQQPFYGQTLELHLALSHSASIDTIRFLLDSNKNLAFNKDCFGQLPLHVALSHHASLEVISLLINANMKACAEDDVIHHSPLIIAFKKNLSADIITAVIHMIEECSRSCLLDELALQHRIFLDLVIGIACSVSEEYILALWNIYPECTFNNSTVSDCFSLDEDRTYTHDSIFTLAIFFKSPLSVIREMLQRDPEMAFTPFFFDGHEILPIHFAVMDNTFPLGIFELLINAYDENPFVDIPLVEINYDIHDNRIAESILELAIKNNACPEVIAALLKLKPQSIQDISECTIILEKEEDEAEDDDEDKGKTTTQLKVKRRFSPLDFAIKYKLSPRASWYLYLASPEDQETTIYNYLSHGASADDFQKLLLQTPIPSSDFNILWLSFMEATSILPIEKTLNVVRELLTILHQHAKSLILFEDPKRKRPIVDWVHFDVSLLMKEFIYLCGRYELFQGPPVHVSATSVVALFIDHGLLNDYRNAFVEMSTTSNLSYENIISLISSVGFILTEADCRSIQNDLLRSHQITSSCKTFIDYCREKFGITRKVVIKFMKDEHQYQREKHARLDLGNRYVVQLLPSPDESLLLSQLKGFTLDDGRISLSSYPHCMILPWADRSLAAIYASERPDVNHVRSMMQRVGEGIRNCHEHGIIHGDLKMLNVVRVDGTIRLIDFDATANLDNDYYGCKFSSGILPPEMFEELDDNGLNNYEQYWKTILEEDPIFWDKISPKLSGGAIKKGYVIKTFISEENNSKIQMKDLPYKPLKASRTIDTWAFGVMLFTLLTGDPWSKVNRDDDLVDYIEIKTAASWTEASIKNKIMKCLRGNSVATDLLLMLLHPKPEKRIDDFNIILSHAFFMPNENLTDLILTDIHNRLIKVDERTQRIELNTIKLTEISEKTYLQLRKTEKVLLKGMLEIADVSVPSCFIIVNQKILPPEVGEKTIEKISKPIIEEKISTAERWSSKIANWGNTVTNAIIDPISTGVKTATTVLLNEETLYLYLVDELTMLPVIDPQDLVYPIEIKKSDGLGFLPKILPLLKVSLKAITLLNGVLGLVKCLGYPVPTVPSEIMERAEVAVGDLSKKSSVEEFDVLQAQLDNSDDNAKVTRGAALRELARFLGEKDPNGLFSGLSRVLTSEGICCWTTKERAELMQTEAEQENLSSYNSQNTVTEFTMAMTTTTTSASTQKEINYELILLALKQQSDMQEATLDHLKKIHEMMR